MNRISRHYVSVDGRLVHFRKAGTGPLLLLLHQSPQSSLDYAELMGRWAGRFTMIAPDRPGCGQSDPLPDPAPGFDDYGDATAAFLDAIGVQRVPVYGFHTGASEALSLAARHPQRVIAVAVNGVAVMTPEERAEIDRDYLPLLEPSWDGAHLAWLWARMREQTVFFPWFKRTRAARMSHDMSPPQRTQRQVLELLRAWRTYQVAYRAAFHFDGVAALRDSRAPVLVGAAGADPLQQHLARLGTARAGVELRSFAAPAEIEAAAAEFLATHAARAAAAGSAGAATSNTTPAAAAAPRERRVRSFATRRFVGPPGAALHVGISGPRDGERLIVLHDAGESATALAPLVAALGAAGYHVLAPDLPGHGESAPLAAGEAWPIDAAGERIADEFAGAPVTLLGLGAGAAVALAAAQLGRMSVRRVIGWQPSQWPAAQRAEIVAAFASTPVPDWHGGHLSHAWHRSRDAGLYHPWCLRRSAQAWQDEPRIDTLAVHERCTALLLSGDAGPALAAAAAADDLRERIGMLAMRDVPVEVLLDAAAPPGYLSNLRELLQGSRATHAEVDSGLATAMSERLAGLRSA